MRGQDGQPYHHGSIAELAVFTIEFPAISRFYNQSAFPLFPCATLCATLAPMKTENVNTVPAWFPVLGAEVHSRLMADKLARVTPSETVPGCFESDSLCQWQSKMDSRNYVTAKLEKNSLGWSLRHASGLNGFRLIASVRNGTLDGTYKDAFDFAKGWQNQDPTKRVVLQDASESPIVSR